MWRPATDGATCILWNIPSVRARGAAAGPHSSVTAKAPFRFNGNGRVRAHLTPFPPAHTHTHTHTRKHMQTHQTARTFAHTHTAGPGHAPGSLLLCALSPAPCWSTHQRRRRMGWGAPMGGRRWGCPRMAAAPAQQLRGRAGWQQPACACVRACDE